MSAAPRLATDALHDRAAQDLEYIRAAMERAGTFTAVSGVGYIVLGTTALIATYIGAQTSSFEQWLLVWGVELVVAAVLAVLLIAAKARRIGLPLMSGAGRKLMLVFTPVMAAGGALTFAIARIGARELLPGTWLAVYGAAVIAGGVYSIPPVPILGAAMLFVGMSSLLFPAIPGDVVLALGFGVLHIIGGVIIARRHGG
jgi:hypothetical protein